MKVSYTTIDEYILTCPEDKRILLQEFREFINSVAPTAAEKISWGMATFTLYGNLVHFACCKNHIGFYPGDTAVMAFKDELKQYKTTKGAIQFPFDKPIPYSLVKEIVEFCINDNTDKYNYKMKK